MQPSPSVWMEAGRFGREGTIHPGSTVTPDVAVIGGGMAGLSTALHLLRRQPGLRVAVLEAEHVGAGASGHTTGMLGPGVGQSLPALLRRLGPARARALYRATLTAVSEVRALVEREGIDCELEMTGQVMMARTRGAQARLGAFSRALEVLGLPGDRLDEDGLGRIIRLQPPARPLDATLAAIRFSHAGMLHPLKLLHGLCDRVVAAGGVVYEGARVVAIGDGEPVELTVALRDHGHAGENGANGNGSINGGANGNGDASGNGHANRNGHTSGNGHATARVRARHVVVATAGYTPGLGLFRGRILPVHLQVLATEPLDSAARAALGWRGREALLDARRIFDYFRLTADDRIIFGGGAPRYRWAGRTDADAASGARALDRLAARLGRVLPAAAGVRVAGGWAGVIGYVIDALPAIERLRGRPSLLHAVGWCGHGVALALAAGRWVAHIICDGAAPEDLPWYRDHLPLVPFEPVRWVGFRSMVAMMSLLDRMG